ncbi:MAG TPA: GNAT family N-acetyltransferase [Solirubrobacteraceae bacterium]|nr:GNAT family N-acetyltransferase [Solirubrobacteraceae bacterium]
MPAIPEPPARLADDVVELRAIAEWDIPEILIAHQDDPALHRLLGQQRPPTGAQLGSEVERAPAVREAGLGISLTLVEPGHNDCRGRVEVSQIDWENASAQLRVWVAPQFRGRGFAHHALELASDWLSNQVGLHELTVTAAIDTDSGA